MFQIEIENPCNENAVRSLFDFNTITLKFKKTFYGDGSSTDRTKMKLEELDIDHKPWMKANLTMENGLIEFRIPRRGKYQIIQQSRSSRQNHSSDDWKTGINVEFKLDLKKVKFIKLWKKGTKWVL